MYSTREKLHRFKDQDSSSCCTGLGGKDLARMKNERVVVVLETEKSEIPEVLLVETRFVGEEPVPEGQIRTTAPAVVALAAPEELGKSRYSCWFCDEGCGEAVHLSPLIGPAIAEAYLRASGVRLGERVV
jgi:hypothetical protein